MREWLELLGWLLVGAGVIGATAILWAIEPSSTPIPSFQRAVVVPQVFIALAAFLGGVVPGSILLALSSILGRLERISVENQKLLRALEAKI